MSLNLNERMAKVRKLSKPAIQRIIDAAPERRLSDPLSGLVHIKGIGHVPVQMLRQELDWRRKK